MKKIIIWMIVLAVVLILVVLGLYLAKGPLLRCGIENCHGAIVECGPEPRGMCIEILMPGDQCRKYASCEMVGLECQRVEEPEYAGCLEGVNNYGDDRLCVMGCGR